MNKKEKQLTKNAFQNINDSLKFSYNLTNSLNQNIIQVTAISFELKKFAEACKFREKIFSEILKQLARKNIDSAVINGMEIFQITTLYKNSIELGLAFGDLVEDSLKRFGRFEYQKTLNFLEIIKKRQKQIAKPKLNSKKLTNKDIQSIGHSEALIKEIVRQSLAENKGICLKDNEISLFKLLKQNKYLPNKALANVLGYNIRNIEEIRKNLRQKFNLDDFGEIKDKYFLKRILVELAQQIEIEEANINI